ncbi:MAG TPA: pre-peptidase C-terminal domain-containing protein [Candidatus Acidoferrales bacterium]|nr:pre-peptidase C-terminal domain-containing protein [Candidatus Acidoferrales bacterium]
MKCRKSGFFFCLGGLTLASLIAGAMLLAPRLFAANPTSGTLSPNNLQVTWTGSVPVSSPATGCFPLGVASPLCDFFTLTFVAPNQSQYLVRISIVATNGGDDLDLSVRDSAGNPIGSSTTGSGTEDIILVSPPAGTYTVAIRPFLVVPPSLGAYSGRATLDLTTPPPSPNSFRATPVPPGFAGVPQNSPSSSIAPEFKVSSTYVGRQAAEPTIGINANNVAFYAASTFDFPTSTVGELARTLIMRSTDKGKTWQAVSPDLVSNLPESEVNATFPPFSLDPYIHVDPVGLNPSTKNGRVFSFDLDLVCGGNAAISDDGGNTWAKVPLFGCTTPVNDHQTLLSAPPPPGFTTSGYPRMLYFCFNRVADSSCNRSNNGGLTWVPTGNPAYLGDDPANGGFCGGLTGQLAADSAGRVFLPKGHCGNPFVSVSSDAGTNWTRVKIAGHLPMADHEVSLAVDTADNIYAVWMDGVFRLPFLSFSTDHGLHWSTPVMIAPPPVHQVDFPTIVAGDPGRIAVLFPGSESSSTTDPKRPWNAYVLISTNALAASPTFTWTTANDPKDPVHRGSCGPDRCDAEDSGSMFDFLDIQFSPSDGIFWGTVSDTCVTDPDPAKNCVTNPDAVKLRPGQGVAFRQIKGPLLFKNK